MVDRAQYRIIATRPAAQNRDWCTQLQHLGFKTLDAPMLEIVPATAEKAVNAIKQKVLGFDLYQAVIFVSQNAVTNMAEWIEQYWPQLPVGVRYFSVGKKTAQTLQERFGLAQDQVTQASAAMNSEALLELPALQHVEQQKILICRGIGGRPKLGEVLAARGAIVDYCELYIRQMPNAAAEPLKVQPLSSGADIITVFSGETLNKLLHLTESSAAIKLADLLATPILVPGQRVAKQAKQAGFSRILVAENASENTMLKTLIENIE